MYKQITILKVSIQQHYISCPKISTGEGVNSSSHAGLEYFLKIFLELLTKAEVIRLQYREAVQYLGSVDCTYFGKNSLVKHNTIQ